MNAPDVSPWLTTSQAATYVQASEATIMRAARSRRLRAFKLAQGRIWRFRVEDLDAWLRQTGEPIAYEAQR